MQWFEIAKFHLKQIIIKSISKLHKHLHLLKIINEIIKLKNATSTSIKKKKNLQDHNIFNSVTKFIWLIYGPALAPDYLDLNLCQKNHPIFFNNVLNMNNFLNMNNK